MARIKNLVSLGLFVRRHLLSERRPQTRVSRWRQPRYDRAGVDDLTGSRKYCLGYQ